MAPRAALDAVKHAALWFEHGRDGLAPLIDAIGDSKVVLVGEASHGTSEFYRIRADLTAALITQKGFNIVAAEADWPDAYRVNRWVRQMSDDPDASTALSDFTRFPRWMWRNDVVVDFITWLRGDNASRAVDQRCGWYGLDLYSLHRSMEAVLNYLGKVDPDAARSARDRYACFGDLSSEGQSYGYATRIGLTRSCEDEVVAQLVELTRRSREFASRDGRVAEDEYFHAEQNARLVKNAEQYYRAMFGGRVESWNLRDTHMMETLQSLIQWTGRRSGTAKAVVWAHNSHLGDARFTQMGDYGELNLGQLVREEYGPESFLVGFTTHNGTVTAARDWDQPAEFRQVRPSLEESWERLCHDVGLERFLLLFGDGALRKALVEPRLERAIGVVYLPETERASHYFKARITEQFDALLHVDTTTALRPLEPWSSRDADLPETYPTGV